MPKPDITKITVMDQRTGPGGHETCGYHTLKNTLLGLMWAQGVINDKQFSTLRNDNKLFTALFYAVKREANDIGDRDLTLPMFKDILEEMKSGIHDFSKHGISNESIQSLKLDESLIATQTYTWPGMPAIGLSGHNTDLSVAASLAKLARTEGKVNRAFAIGLNDQHWVTAIVKQDEHGARKWYFMDSWRNQSRFQNVVVDKIEFVLNKSEPELREYLVEAYDNVNDLFLHVDYNRFFNPDTGLPYSGKVPGFGYGELISKDSKDYFIRDQKQFRLTLGYIEQNYQFMQDAGWFNSPNEAETARMKILYNLSHFVLKNAEEILTEPEENLRKAKEDLVNAEKELLAADEHFNRVKQTKTISKEDKDYKLASAKFKNAQAKFTNAQAILENAQAHFQLEKEAVRALKPMCEQLETVFSKNELSSPKTPEDSELPEIQYSETELKAEIAKIKDNRFDIKGHFKTLLPMLLNEEQREQDKLSIVPKLVDEDSLATELQKDYSGKDYVVMFYAHKPNSPAISPFYPDEPRAHTSVLLCKVDNGKIQKTLNIDAYNFTSYVDIMGERSGTPNPHIQKRLVLEARPNASASKDAPIQQPSWNNMNCMLYSFTIVEQLLNVFKNQAETLSNVFDDTSDLGPEVSAWLLKEGILSGMEGTYLTKNNGNRVVDKISMTEHHDRIREELATQFKNQHTKAAVSQESEALKDAPVTAQHLPVDSNSPKIENKPKPREKVKKEVAAEPQHKKLERKKLEAQQKAAHHAVHHGTPKPTEGFVARFVNAIKIAWESVVNWVAETARSIGLVH